MRIIFDPTEISRPTAIALGNFDGVHIGHHRVIAPILPQSLSDRHLSHLNSTVVSFSPHPQEFFSKKPKELLAPFAEKTALLESLGVEQLVLLPFDDQLSQLTAAEFMQQILIDSMQVQLISVGFDFRFGRQRQGSIIDLHQVWGDRLTVIPEQTLNVNCEPVRISSSNIRQALAQGNIDLATCLLGRPYELIGIVEQGKQLGRTIGFPTANLAVPANKCLPRQGVYAVQVNILGASHGEKSGVMNIGMRPTVDAQGDRLTIEVHLLDWQGDLYGQQMSVKIIKFIRPEQKFNGLAALTAQIHQDCQTAKQYLEIQRDFVMVRQSA
ncbi:MAG: bifunctional riboflavin kinase/FAD synthetase [Pseudanabaenaceae cyanobacterium bins.39]|nr:bifunctional riboflavin kinase/FAD synthetase [Pseudanabaenaceae cyanobacterium bins.39]